MASHRVGGPSQGLLPPTPLQPINPPLVYVHEGDSPASPPPLMEVEVPVPAGNKRPLIQEGWNLVIKPKKGKVTNTKITPTPVSNSFTPLATASTSHEPTPAPAPKPRRPPPIVLESSKYSTTRLAASLRSIGISSFRVHNTPKGLNVYIDSQADYERATETLRATQDTVNPVFFHTYAPKGSRPNQKFLLIGLDEEHPLDSVRAALSHPDLIDVRRLTSVRDGVKIETPNVLVTFRPTYNYNDHLKSIRAIDNIIIRHKPFTPNTGLPTCGKCQAIGHTKRYCWRPKRCVRCGDNHSVEECPPEKPLVCSNCQGNHPASFRQCPARLRLLQKSLMGKPQIPAPRPVPRHPPPPPPSVWGPPILPGAPTASHRLFPRSHPPPPTTPQVPLPPTSSPQSLDSTPRWVADFTSTLTSMLNTLISTVQSLLSTLPQMLLR